MSLDEGGRAFEASSSFALTVATCCTAAAVATCCSAAAVATCCTAAAVATCFTATARTLSLGPTDKE